MCIRNVIDLKIYFLNKNDQINISHLQQSKQKKYFFFIYKKTQSTSSSNAKGIQIKNEKQL